jgi:hypothetical protein
MFIDLPHPRPRLSSPLSVGHFHLFPDCLILVRMYTPAAVAVLVTAVKASVPSPRPSLCCAPKICFPLTYSQRTPPHAYPHGGGSRPVEIRVESAWFQRLTLTYKKPISSLISKLSSTTATRRHPSGVEVSNRLVYIRVQEMAASVVGASRHIDALASSLPEVRPGACLTRRPLCTPTT